MKQLLNEWFDFLEETEEVSLAVNEQATKLSASQDMTYHIENGIPLTESIYRPGSKAFLNIMRECRSLAEKGLYTPSALESYYIFETNLGEQAEYEGEIVNLDWPEPDDSLYEAEYKGKNVELNSPMRSSGPKKYKVYTKNKKGKVIKVNFGDVKGGLTAKFNDEGARANFAARHDCDSKSKKDKTKPGYWSCRLPRYWEDLGFKKNSYRFW